MEIACSWADVKKFRNDRKCSLQYILLNSYYTVFAYDGPVCLHCVIPYTDPCENGTDQYDFETNYKSGANKVIATGKDGLLTRTSAFADSDFYRFRGVGFFDTATGGTSTSLLYKFTNPYSMNGCQILLKNQVFGDCLDFYIIDVDNVVGYGAGVVLDSFVEDWCVADDVCGQSPVILPYKANIITGLYAALIYHSTGITNVQVGCNFYRHKKE